jgi:hypothetical protein
MRTAVMVARTGSVWLTLIARHAEFWREPRDVGDPLADASPLEFPSWGG